jgi:hypothetical protein
MDHNEGHGQAADPHGSKMSGAQKHDRHAGHSVAMFRDKFWLSLSSRFPWSSGRQTSNTGWDTQRLPSPDRSLFPRYLEQSSSFMGG